MTTEEGPRIEVRPDYPAYGLYTIDLVGFDWGEIAEADHSKVLDEGGWAIHTALDAIPVTFGRWHDRADDTRYIDFARAMRILVLSPTIIKASGSGQRHILEDVLGSDLVELLYDGNKPMQPQKGAKLVPIFKEVSRLVILDLAPSRSAQLQV